MPADILLCNPGVIPEAENSIVDYVARQQERFRSAYEILRNHLKSAAQKRKAYYDARVPAKTFKEGGKVWYFYPRKYVKRSRKWSFVYFGPYTIIKRLSEHTFLIQKSKMDKPLVVHVDKLKICSFFDNLSDNKMDKVVCYCFLQAPAVVSMEPADDPQRPTEIEDQSNKKFQCPKCGRRFRRKFDLTRHDVDIHLQIREHCPLCEAVLGSVNSLRRHLLELHGAPMTTRLHPRRTAAERAALGNQIAEEEVRPGVVPLMSIPVQRSFRVRVETERDRRVLVPLRKAENIVPAVAAEYVVPEGVPESPAPGIALEDSAPDVAVEHVVTDVVAIHLVREAAAENFMPEVTVGNSISGVTTANLVPEVAGRRQVPECTVEEEPPQLFRFGEEKLPGLVQPNSEVEIPAAGPPKFLETCPSPEEKKMLRDRVEVWRRRILEVRNALDPEVFLQRVRRHDPQLGFAGFFAVEQLVAMRNDQLAMGATKQIVTHQAPQEKPKAVRTRSVPRGRRCTDDPVPTRRSDRVWRLPASATVSRNPEPEAEESTMQFQALLPESGDPGERTVNPVSMSVMDTVEEAVSDPSKVTAENIRDPILPSVIVEPALPSVPLVDEEVFSVLTDGIFSFMEEDYFVIGEEDL